MDFESQHTLGKPEETHWIPLSDLMTGLMMMFLLLSLVFMVKVEANSKEIEKNAKQIQIKSNQIREIAILYEKMKVELYKDMYKEFEKDLNKWGAEIDADTTIRFKEPDVLFATGDAELKPKFVEILDDFFPRYVNILTSDKYRNVIQEVRIEGHTSSFWAKSISVKEAYFKNMALSQARTRSTLQYVMSIPEVETEFEWLKRFVTANGLSSSHLILNSFGKEDFGRSQRVEFRVRTDSESRIAKIIESTSL